MIHATPPRFGTQPLDETDDLFDLIEQVCADCGQSFQASRRSPRCATCASLHTSKDVGPATVVCPACGIEHQIPILKPHTLCLSCSADMSMTLASARVRLEQARDAAQELTNRLLADVAHADEPIQVRYYAAIGLRTTGHYRGVSYDAPTRAQMWATALTKEDLGPLLALYDRWDAAQAATVAAERAVTAVEEAIES